MPIPIIINNFNDLGFFSGSGFSTGFHHPGIVLMIPSPPAQNLWPFLQWSCQAGVNQTLEIITQFYLLFRKKRRIFGV
jgi:hypothetical protein